MGIGRKAIHALAWSALDRTAQQTLQLIIGIVLARMLAPADFGIMGIIMLFAGLSYVLVEGGFGQAVAREREAAESYFSSVFYLNLAVAAGLYILFFFTAPLIARFFGQPLLASVI